MPIKLRFSRTERSIESPVLTTNEAADYLHVSKSTLTKMVKEGWVVPSRTPGSHFRFTVQQLNEALDNSRKPKAE